MTTVLTHHLTQLARVAEGESSLHREFRWVQNTREGVEDSFPPGISVHDVTAPQETERAIAHVFAGGVQGAQCGVQGREVLAGIEARIVRDPGQVTPRRRGCGLGPVRVDLGANLGRTSRTCTPHSHPTPETSASPSRALKGKLGFLRLKVAGSRGTAGGCVAQHSRSGPRGNVPSQRPRQLVATGQHLV